MKVRCIKLLNLEGEEIDSSSWMRIGEIYHVLSIFIDQSGKRSFAIVANQRVGEWPTMVSHPAECFEIVSTVVPSNWSPWIHSSSAIGISPVAWQDPAFAENFFDHDPQTYQIFEREQKIILQEDP